MFFVQFLLSLRSVENSPHEWRIDVGHEAVWCWCHHFNPVFTSKMRKRRTEGMRTSRWRGHLDKVSVRINGEMRCLWRAVDQEVEVPKRFATKTPDKKAALKVPRKAMRIHSQSEVTVSEHSRSNGAEMKEIGAASRQETGHWPNNRAENSHMPFR